MYSGGAELGTGSPVITPQSSRDGITRLPIGCSLCHLASLSSIRSTAPSFVLGYLFHRAQTLRHLII